MKSFALALGLGIMAVGILGALEPPALASIARRFVGSGAFGFYVIALIRISFGLVLVSVASASRAPKSLRVIGYIIVIAGVTTALTGMTAIERAHASIDWWLRQGSSAIRGTGVLLLALGGFVVYALAPRRRVVSC